MKGPSVGCLLASAFLVVGSALVGLRQSTGVPLLAVAIALAWTARRRESEAERQVRAREQKRRRVLFHEVAPPAGDAWRLLLAACGLGDVVFGLAPHVRKAVRLEATPVDDLPVGRSRVGGLPDLPLDVPWPRQDGDLLEFVAQLDLEDIGRVLPDSALPSAGHLWFFEDHVFYRPKGTALARCDAAAGRAPYRLCALTFDAYEDLPHPEVDGRVDAQLADPGDRDLYFEIRAYVRWGLQEKAHKLLGFEEGVPGPREAGRRLLLQVVSDENAGMSWGDGGTLCFWIGEEDLRARRFERAVSTVRGMA